MKDLKFRGAIAVAGLVLLLGSMPAFAYDPCRRAIDEYNQAQAHYIAVYVNCRDRPGCNPERNPQVEDAYQLYAAAYARMSRACAS